MPVFSLDDDAFLESPKNDRVVELEGPLSITTQFWNHPETVKVVDLGTQTSFNKMQLWNHPGEQLVNLLDTELS